jgi:beta-lactamase superfamily II metal-dependent hydrolase
MKLEIFQSDMGDCLLLEGADGRLMLIDGGMSTSYRQHVAPRLAALEKEERVLDVVYVSHIDRDHISGVLQMLDDEVLWIAHEHQITDNPGHKRPPRDRTPKIKNIWHNAFNVLVEDKEGELEEMLAASAAVLSGADDTVLSSSEDLARVRALASEYADLATGYEDAIRVSNRVGRNQLNIKLNAPAKKKLMMVRGTKPKPLKFGGMKIHIIGPTKEALDGLKKEWDEWLGKHKDKLDELREQAEKDADMLKAREAADVLRPKVRQAGELISLLQDSLSQAEPDELGKPRTVTAPNVASLMLFVEEKGQTLLLTGDGRHEEITDGLKRIGKLKEGGGLHVNVLKVQHHGSKNNISHSFCRAVTADHYLFCGFNGGLHSNPRPEVIEAIAASRLSKDAAVRSPNPEAGNPFTFHFSGSVAVAKGNDKDHMKKVEKVVKRLAGNSNNQMGYYFLEGSSFVLDI